MSVWEALLTLKSAQIARVCEAVVSIEPLLWPFRTALVAPARATVVLVMPPSDHTL